MWKALLLSIVTIGSIFGELLQIERNDLQSNFSFEIDYSNNQFLLDGQPFRYVSGSFHYFRTPKRYWRDRLRKMRAAGLNAVSTYVEWSLHQPEIDVWNWSGEADFIEFLNIAQEENLLVLLRPGPYICAERDFGGFPYWLLTRVPDIKLRTNDIRYLNYVEQYLNVVLNKVKPYLRGNGGPIIMVQVENEYGSYGACDSVYMKTLRNIFQKIVGNKAVLYTTDGINDRMIRCGSVSGVYTTIDFGTGSNVNDSFELMRQFQPRGPLINSEFYPGWLTHWEEPFQRVSANAVQQKLDEMLALGASVNIYMFYGGTNFGFTSGANGDSKSFNPQLTSYDYDAPLTEAGDPTEKYFLIRDVISKYLPLPNISLPTVSPKGDYGPILLEPVLDLFEPKSRELFGSPIVFTSHPPTFEEIGLPHWLVLYETNIPSNIKNTMILNALTKDRALIYVDSELVGTLSRMKNIYSLPLVNPHGQSLKILVENQGHLNYGNEIHDFKGIFNVNINGVPLSPWNVTGFRLSDVKGLNNFTTKTIETSGILLNGPVFFRSYFYIPDQPLDTYLDTIGWGKGIAYVNGYNLGRYWPMVGPQMTLYIPAPFLRTGQNLLEILELQYVPATRKMRLQDKANLNFSVVYTENN
ncbi:beta-galactosidase [Vespa crabro]|uniref:beta-galactosidase n=1 Tax=Vespa crabro TaxID=7445 RepID=UPI001F01EE60|nr:beta-galactosidase [Vespa crabro]XP_046827580.1 beta-galactosidase [Vespa crabro]XP_046827581.1 beta-galactosidase [Vespa crabro]XP_046827582.1 beta-galactosidase [Vespa crabro]